MQLGLVWCSWGIDIVRLPLYSDEDDLEVSADGQVTHSLISKPDAAPRSICSFWSLDSWGDVQLDISRVARGKEMLPNMNGSSLLAKGDSICCHGWVKVRMR